MAVRNLTKDNGPIILQEDRELYGTPWHFRLEVPHAFWEDIFDQIDHSAAPRTAMAAYERDPDFWSWLMIRLADAASASATPGAFHRTLSLGLPADPPKSVYDDFERFKIGSRII